MKSKTPCISDSQTNPCRTVISATEKEKEEWVVFLPERVANMVCFSSSNNNFQGVSHRILYGLSWAGLLHEKKSTPQSAKQTRQGHIWKRMSEMRRQPLDLRCWNRLRILSHHPMTVYGTLNLACVPRTIPLTAGLVPTKQQSPYSSRCRLHWAF